MSVWGGGAEVRLALSNQVSNWGPKLDTGTIGLKIIHVSGKSLIFPISPG